MTEVEQMQADARTAALEVRGRTYSTKSGSTFAGLYSVAKREEEPVDAADAASCYVHVRPGDIASLSLVVGTTFYDSERKLSLTIKSIVPVSGGMTAIGCIEHPTP